MRDDERWRGSTLIEIALNTGAINIDGDVCDVFNYRTANIWNNAIRVGFARTRARKTPLRLRQRQF